MDVLPSLDCSSSVINHQEEEDDDDWVVVKKQKIIILIPPPSPPNQQIMNQMSPDSTEQPKSVKTSPQKTGNKPHFDGSDEFDRKPKLRRPPLSLHAHGVGNVGAMNIANRRMRAMNLRRKLLSLGGMRRWLSMLGLGRFAEFFESRKVGEYQLVNLSASRLKDMGMNAVGPRRKLIHAIDLLCQPYYRQGF